MASPFDSQYNDIRNKIIYYANKYGIDANIFIWQIWQENKFRATGCSGAGACGIAQFIAATAARFNVNRSDIDSSLDGAARYMKWLLAQSYINGNYSLALAGYNAGEGRVKQYGGIPPFTETRNYVNTILGNAAKTTVSGVTTPIVVDTNTVTQILTNNQTNTGQNIPTTDTAKTFSNNEILIGASVLLLILLL